MPKVTGRGNVTKRLNALPGPEKVELVGQALEVAGGEIRAEASHLITRNAVGGKFHVPSLPGQPPNEDTGHLRSLIEVERVAPLRVEISSNAEYAAMLEFGTSKMAARPYMGPAARNKRKRVVELVGKSVSIAIRRK